MEWMTKYCQRKLRNKNWFPWLFESIQGGTLCTGAVCPPITRGPRKGMPNFRKRDMATVERVFIPAQPMPKVIQCKKCCAVFPRGKKCPGCGV